MRIMRQYEAFHLVIGLSVPMQIPTLTINLFSPVNSGELSCKEDAGRNNKRYGIVSRLGLVEYTIDIKGQSDMPSMREKYGLRHAQI